MDSSPPVPLSFVPFYGLQSKKRNLNIKRALETTSKRLKDDKFPSLFRSRILGPSTRWQIFYRQQEALDFASDTTEDLHVFAFECQQPDKQSGQRQFLTATYAMFWHYYMQLDKSQRHHYEVIPEGHPCKLYFDLEFHKPTNPDVNGDMMVNILIKYVCCWMQELYNVHCCRNDVLELSATTETKFSRHLIFQLKENVFRDNVTAGDFIHAMFHLLEDYVFGELDKTDTEGKAELHKEKAALISSLTSKPNSDADEKTTNKGFQGADSGICGDVGCMDNAEFTADTEVNKKASSRPHVLDGKKTNTEAATSTSLTCPSCGRTDSVCTGEATECSVFCMPSSSKKLPCRKDDKNGEQPSRDIDQQREAHQRSHEGTAVSISKNQSHHTENIRESNSISGEKALPSRQSAQLQESMDVSMGMDVNGEKEEQNMLKDTQISKEKMTGLRDRVFQQFKMSDLRSLYVKDKEGRDACFADLGVYTKNRNFRLYKSCKLGKTTAFTIASGNTFTDKDTANETQRERDIFMASLITNVSGSEKLLTFGDRADCAQPSNKHGKNRTQPSHGSRDGIEGFGKSPYPEVDDFISCQVSGQGGTVRRWSYFPAAETLSFDIVGYRFCHNIQRQHRSNNIRLVADLQKGVWYQKCYDPDCQAVNFKSEEFKLPSEILPANYFNDDFEDFDDNSMDEDDEACLLALQDAEHSLTSTTSTKP
ncbi:DNA-directed primase/polymerase protein-like [Babylonia areolata]|uniref:DNA-directed primase/polymerase protein-like n=1 Tax=Babylonia areolata TaxID=304850 RepID=UPI003FD6A2AB